VWVNQGRKPSSSLPAALETHMTYEVLNVYPHDPQAFTQGLIYQDGYLFESTGLYGESTLRKVALETGEVLKEIDLAPEYFAEGLTDWDGTLIQLTWREGTGFVYRLDDFSLLQRFIFSTEGWGLTQDGERLIMSDGTAALYFLNPETFLVEDSVTVTYQGELIQRVNELEYVRGEVYANIWQTEQIIRIDPASGQVLGWIDLSGILPPELRKEDTNVLNGIAYDPERDRLFITGKFWPSVFEVRLTPKPEGH
jgi:glutamine cyclotransferase